MGIRNVIKRALCSVFLFTVSQMAIAGVPAPTFTKVFSPDTIGPGSVSQLRFDIVNNDATFPLNEMAFTDMLPAGVTIADPANVFTTCLNATISAPDGGGTITMSDGELGVSQSCFVTVDVTSITAGVHMNVSSVLSSDHPDSGTATDDLTVDTSLPGFSMSFAPSTVPLGDRSTLTYLIDNSSNAANVSNLDFTDTFPSGIVIAEPANASTTCGTPTIPATLTASAGTNIVTLDSNGIGAFPAVALGSTCTVTVDVVTILDTRGVISNLELDNISGELLADFVSAGKASATLGVDIYAPHITKEFIDDPAPPGGVAGLQFTIYNFNRFDEALNIAFDDDLDATLTGLAPTGMLPTDPCGVGSSLSFMGGVLSMTGGTLPAEGQCTFTVNLLVPAGATPGAYTNTTDAITADIGGVMETGNMASDTLYAEPAPVLQKLFTDDPVSAGDPVTLQFTVTNTSTTSMATDITFQDELTDGGPGTGFLPFPVTVTLPPVPNPPCGAGSSMALVSAGFDRQALELTGGSLAAAGMPGDSCTFEVTVTIPNGFAEGTYLNTTGPISATVDGGTRVGNPAMDDLVVVAAPQLSKEFLSVVAPGNNVDLQFELSYPAAAAGDATGVTFTDDLTALTPALAGLTTAAPVMMTDVCSTGDSLTSSAGDTLITYSGGTFQPGDTCMFTVSLTVPAMAGSNTYTNTTSTVSATVLGVAASNLAAEADLVVSAVSFSKEFLDNPYLPGAAGTLRFTIDNTLSAEDLSITFFTDNLTAALTSLAATGAPSFDDCGGTMSGTTFLIYTGGSVLAGASCTIDVPILVPAGAADGAYTNITSSLSGTLAMSGGITVPPAIADIVVDSNLLQLTKTFTDDPVIGGDTATIEFELTNLDPAQPATSIAFNDDLTAMLAGTTIVALPSAGMACNGSGTLAEVPAGTLDFSGGSLAAGASCTFSATIMVPGGTAAGDYLNTTSAITGMIGGLPVNGAAASDTLTVNPDIGFSKSFAGPAAATGMTTLMFTIENNTTGAINGISFNDDLDAVITGLTAANFPATPCGGLSAVSGTSLITFTGGELPAMSMCSFSVDIMVPAGVSAGTYANTTSDLFLGGVSSSAPATDDLEIEPPPAFTKTFTPDQIGLGQNSTLAFSIDNSANTLASTALAFTDTLPAGMVVATPPSVSGSCGGTVTAVAGSGSISLSGGSLAAGGACTIMVQVNGTGLGALVNTTSDLTSSTGNSGPASDTLTVNPQPGFSKAFSPNPILVGEVTTLTFTIDNSGSATAATSLSFNDDLPMGVTLAMPVNDNSTCGGFTVASTGGSGDSVGLGGGSVAAASTCTVTFDVTSSVPGMHVNTSDALTSNLGNSGTATDTLTVNPPPTFSKVFAPAAIAVGDVSTLTFTIDNTASTVAATALDFTDTLPAAVIVATPSNATTDCTGGTLTAADGSGSVTYSGGTVAAGGSCTISVDTTSSTVGSHVNTTGDLTSSSGNSGTASDTLVVDPAPSFSKAFSPTAIAVDGVSTLTFTIDNTAATQLAATSLAFTDNLPAGMLVATPGNAVNNCSGGTLTAADGSGTIMYSGGTVAATQACTITVDVTATSAGPFNNTSGDLTSSLGNSGPASAMLTADAPPLFSKTFAPDAVAIDAVSTLTFTIDLSASLALDASSLDFTDTLPGSVVVAATPNAMTDCTGGTITAVAGSGSISYSGGTVSQGTACTLSVDVSSSAAGSFDNMSGDLTSSLGNSGNATDTLTVDAPPTFAKAFAPTSVAIDEVSTLTFTIDLSASLALDASALDFTDTLPGSVVVAATPNAMTDCTGGTITAVAGSGSISYSGGTVSQGTACTLSVDVSSSAAGSFDNVSGDLTSSLGNSGNATDTLIVEGPPAFAKAFAPAAVAIDEVSTLTFTIDNSGSATLPANSLDFTDNLPGVVVVATTPNASTTCTGGTLTAVAGSASITYTGGSVAASSSCTVSVDVSSPSTGSFDNLSGDLTSTLGNSGTAADTLLVEGAPIFSKAFSPTAIPISATSTLTLTIDNTGASALSADSLDFTDNLPGSVVVAATPNASTTCTGGTLTAVAGSSVISYSGGSVAAASSCSVSVDVSSPSAGSFDNVTGDLTSTLGNSGTATANLVVEAVPMFSKLFQPDTIFVDGVSVLEFQIDNTAIMALSADNLDFTDNLPGTIVVGNPANIVNTCTGGTLTAVPGSTVISYTGGSVAAMSSCSIAVDVTSDTSGVFDNISGDLTSSLGNSGPATDTLTVVDNDLTFGKTFQSAPVIPGGSVDLEYTLTNTSDALDATDLTFDDDFDAALSGLQIGALPADGDCGVGSVFTGTNSLNMTGGTLAPSSSCTFTVSLVVPVNAPAGDVISTSGTLTGVAAGLPITDGEAIDTLMVEHLGFSKTFESMVEPGGDVVLGFMISNPDPVNTASGITFSDDLNAMASGLVPRNLPQSDVCGVGSTLTGDRLFMLNDGILAGGEDCEFGVTISVSNVTNPGDYPNVTSPLNSIVGGNAVAGGEADTANDLLSVVGQIATIPTLGRWMMILMVLLISSLAVVQIRRD
ncbi:MAG: hypothetical protein DHS20C11_28200 [Lysobacteraceae bacterium]|nr:MAG: hypothetical protein DHS20C11_28200 [Xanthomonadaceae bacterium]